MIDQPAAGYWRHDTENIPNLLDGTPLLVVSRANGIVRISPMWLRSGGLVNDDHVVVAPSTVVAFAVINMYWEKQR